MRDKPVVLRYKVEFLPLSETFIYNQIRALKRFEAVVVTEKRLNEKVYPFDRIDLIERRPALMPPFLARRRFSRQLAAIAHRHHARLVHANFGGIGAQLIGPCRRIGIPLVTSFHGNDVYVLPHKKPGIYDELFRHGALLICTSGYLRARLLKVGAPPDRTIVHHAGIEVAKFPFKERRPNEGGPMRLLAVGRFVRKKGFHLLIDAVHQLAERGRNVELTLVGFGPNAGRLEQFRAAGPGADRIFIRHSDKSPHPHRMRNEELERAHLAVISSSVTRKGSMESLCWYAVEAQACGLPLVATRHNGIPEAVDEGRSAVLVDENDAEALAAGIEQLLDRPADWPAMGRAGRAYVEEKFDLARNTSALEEIYDSII
jgi:glycosyltransferase involved in cell wall biosynthesis